MSFQKMNAPKYPPRHWALVGYPGSGKSTFSTQLRGPYVVIDADQRYSEVLHLAAQDVYPVSNIAYEHADPHAIAKRLQENMPEAMRAPERIGTIIIDSLTAIIAPRVTKAIVEKQEGEVKNLYAAFKDKAMAMRELQDAVTRWGTDTLWIYHLNDASDAEGKTRTKATVSALELVRLTRSINMQMQIVTDEKTKTRGVTIIWSRRGRDGMTLWDESGTWKDMPARIEAAVYDGLTQKDMDRIEASTPEVFASHEVAIDWAMEQGAFGVINHAQNAYKKLLREAQPKDMRAMTPLWIADVQHRIAVKANGDSDE